MLPLRRNPGLSGECSRSQAWILEQARKAADSNQELATEGPLWTHHLCNTLGHLHTPSPVNNSPVMNYMLGISEELDLKQLIFKYFSQKNFFEILEKVFSSRGMKQRIWKRILINVYDGIIFLYGGNQHNMENQLYLKKKKDWGFLSRVGTSFSVLRFCATQLSGRWNGIHPASPA